MVGADNTEVVDELLNKRYFHYISDVGALSLAGKLLPSVSLTCPLPFPLKSVPFLRLPLALSSSSSPSKLSPWKLLPLFLLFNMAARSSSSSSSSSSNAPSAVSTSGALTHSFGTMHGNSIPTVAALFNQLGAFLPVNRRHKKLVK